MSQKKCAAVQTTVVDESMTENCRNTNECNKDEAMNTNPPKSCRCPNCKCSNCYQADNDLVNDENDDSQNRSRFVCVGHVAAMRLVQDRPHFPRPMISDANGMKPSSFIPPNYPPIQPPTMHEQHDQCDQCGYCGQQRQRDQQD